MISAVLFDYGGTLVRSRRPWSEVKAEAMNSEYNVLREQGLGISFDEYLKVDDSIFEKFAQLEAKTNRDYPDTIKCNEVVDSLFPEKPRDWRTDVAAQANKTFWDVTTRNFVLRDKALDSLTALKSMGVGMGVVSNHHNAKALVDHLEEVGILRYFSHVLASSELEFRKPDPRIFESSLSLLGVGRERAVFVGDSIEYDIEGARRTGMRSIQIVDDNESALPGSGQEAREEESAADFVIRNLTDIPHILSLL